MGKFSAVSLAQIVTERPRAVYRLTPSDRPECFFGLEVLQEWQKLREAYERKGLTRKAAYSNIATHYNCSPAAVRSWLEPWHQKSRLKAAIKYNQNHRQNLALRSGVYKQVRRNIEQYLRAAVGEQMRFELGDAAIRIEQICGVRLRERTLQALFAEYAKKNHAELAIKVADAPLTYELRSP